VHHGSASPPPSPEGGLDGLLEGAHVEVRERRPKQALALLQQAESELFSLAEGDERRGRHGALLGHVLRLVGDFAQAQQVLSSVLDQAREHGWAASGARAAVQLAWLVRGQGDTAGAERWMREAVQLAAGAGADEQVLAGAGLAEILSMNGDLGGAERVLDEVSERASSPEMRFRVQFTRAQLADRHGRPEEAERALKLAARLAPGGTAAYEVTIQLAKHALARSDELAALQHARKANRLAADWDSPLVLAGARMLLGEVARTFGRHDEADRAYKTAQQLYGDSQSARIARLNRAQNEIARGRHDLGAALAKPMLAAFPGNPIATSVAELCQLPQLVDRRSPQIVPTADGVLLRLSASGIVHRDLAVLAGHVAQELAGHGWLELAARLEALAHDQWRRIGNADEMVRTATRLRALRSAGAPIPLRQFVLDGVIGEGASGTVWRGRHAPSGEIVAVKILRGGAGATANVRSMFARELRAVAALDHPHVVWLVDHGWIDEAAAVVDPRLELDAPFLALEYAEHGTLDAHCGRLPWASALPVILAVLDALAHAHARGLLHLDLKPTNVLLSGTSLRWIPKLADFGLARAPAPGRQLRATGTPAYMAPEQFGQDAGALGPWTDLYALGCVIAAMVTGTPPFGLGGAAQLRDAHLNREVPDLSLTTPVPSGLLDIVRRLLAKPPGQRFRSAADVVRAISSLGPPDLESGPIEFDTRVDTVPTVLLQAIDTSSQVDGEGPHEPHEPPRPRVSFPDRWQDGVPHTRPRSLVAAGLGLVSLRRPRTVGRERERDLLWARLSQVVGHCRGDALLVWGPPGAGARQLVRWLAERAHELGAARGLMLQPESGLPSVLSADDDEAVRQELERLAASRPLVVGLLHLDLLKGGERLLRLAPSVRAPMLIATTLSPTASAAPGGVETLALPPLPSSTLLEIVAMLLPLAPQLAEPICARALGNPGAVVRMVRQLAQERQLVPGPDGWRLRPTADLEGALGGSGVSRS
jgi:serine/threonine protein kinase/tetratricopeptide (TPR) repeat protein